MTQLTKSTSFSADSNRYNGCFLKRTPTNLNNYLTMNFTCLLRKDIESIVTDVIPDFGLYVSLLIVNGLSALALQ